MSNPYGVKSCPVPTEQQPVNEYEQLKESWYFSWAALPLNRYCGQLTWVWCWGWVIAGPIAAGSFAPGKRPWLFVITASSGSAFFVLIVVIQLYLAWNYVKNRLTKETVSYEESGWYDGQTWTKPGEILSRDRLIASYQVQPILRLLTKTTLILISLIALSLIAWLGLR